MSQQVDNNIAYIDTQIDKEGNYVIKKLNPMQDDTSSIPGLSGLQIDGDVSVQGYSKTVGQIDGFNTRITQNETEISLVATDVDQNTAQLTVQAGQITAVVADTASNTTLIAQNATDITIEANARSAADSTLQSQISVNASAISLEVTERTNADSVLQSSITINSNNIALKVSADDVINSINISTEGVRIDASKLEIDGTTIFSSGYDPTTKETPAGAQAKVDSLENSLGDLAQEDDVSLAMLDSTIISGGFIKTSLIKTTDLDVSGTFTAGTSSDYIKIYRPTSGTYANVPLIEFVDDAGGDLGGVIYYDDDILNDQLVIKAQGMTLQSRVIISAADVVDLIVDSWSSEVRIEGGDLDMDNNNIDNIDNAYVDDLYVTDIYAQGSFIYVKDPMIFSGSTTTLTIPNGTSSGPEFNGTGTIYYNRSTNKIGIYDGGWIWTDALT